MIPTKSFIVLPILSDTASKLSTCKVWLSVNIPSEIPAMKLNVVSNATLAKDVATKSTTANPANSTIGGTNSTVAATKFTN